MIPPLHRVLPVQIHRPIPLGRCTSSVGQDRVRAYRSTVTAATPTPGDGCGRATLGPGPGAPAGRCGRCAGWCSSGCSAAFGDGAFQGALAVLVLFSPERKSDPAEIAAGFIVLLLPYSIIGPFAGALLDRWSRRRVIVWANLVRCAAGRGRSAMQIAAGLPDPVLFITALLIIGVGRFVGSGLSASMPHTVAKDSLVGANALATTVGCDRHRGRRRVRHRAARACSANPAAGSRSITATVIAVLSGGRVDRDAVPADGARSGRDRRAGADPAGRAAGLRQRPAPRDRSGRPSAWRCSW